MVTRRSLPLRLPFSLKFSLKRPDSPGLIFLALAAAIAANLLPIEVFYGSQFLLGQAFAVLALLMTGRWGILIGLIASIVTIRTLGHPWLIPVVTAELVWLQTILHSPAGVSDDKENGRIVLVDIGFWAILGVPMILLLYGVVMQLNASSLLVEALTVSVNGIINVLLGFMLYLLIRASGWRSEKEAPISLRGLCSASLLFAILLPSLLITNLFSRQLQVSARTGVEKSMDVMAQMLIDTPRSRLQRTGDLLPTQQVAFAFSGAEENRGWFFSDPNLFDELENDYQPSAQPPGGAGHLSLLLPKRPMPLQEKRLLGYWRYDLPQLTLVQPAGEMVLWLRQEAFWSVGLLAGVVLVGAFLSDATGVLLAGQFRAVVTPLAGHPPALDEAMPRLAPSRLRELNVMVRLLNGRILRANNLARALQRSNRELAASQRELERLSSTDTLTGCFNRRELYRRLEEEIRRCHACGDDLACICFDIDHFKAVNDTYGHPTGDAVLRGVSHLVRSRLRSGDCFCRSGGEEFTLLLTSCPRDDARNVAELLRSSIADLWIEHEHTALRVTVSLGVTAFLTDDDAESLLSRADRALYRAKQEGRDRVIVV